MSTWGCTHSFERVKKTKPPVPSTENENLYLNARGLRQMFQNYQSHIFHKCTEFQLITNPLRPLITKVKDVVSLFMISQHKTEMLLRDWKSKSQLIHKVLRKRKIPPYLHTGSLEESSILFLSHFPRFAVHNTEIGEEQNVSTLL